MSRILLWLLANTPLGCAAPWVLGLALKRRPRKIIDAAQSAKEGK